MSYKASELLKIAAAEIGYKEKKSNSQLDNAAANAGDKNYTKYARDLAAAGYYQASKQGFAWCDMFVDWCFLQLCGGDAAKAQELICQTGPYGAGCLYSGKYYKQQGRFYTSNPQPGDQIFFNSFSHTGIVETVTPGRIFTIEGNTNNQVARCSYAVGSKKIDGFGRPKYAVENPVNNVEKPSSGKSVDEIAREVIAGKWYNGEDRRQLLIDAGYDPKAVQDRVNEILLGKTTSKTVDELAREVIAGKWGTGEKRKKKLTAAGYNYRAVQDRVNELLRKTV